MPPRPLPQPEATAQEALDVLFAAAPEAFLRRMPGRETFHWTAPEGERVVKRYRGDATAEAPGWRALGRARRSPAGLEADNLHALARVGVPVPRLVAAWEEREPGSWPAPRWGRSALVMEHVEHAETLRDLARRDGPGATRAWLRPLVRLVAGLHAAGWHHRDLYLHHVVSASAGGLALFDVQRARHRPRARARWYVKDLAALDLSTPESVGTRARLRFLVLYARALAGAGVQRVPLDLRRLARAVRSKSRRMQRHTPRHVDPNDRASKEDS